MPTARRRRTAVGFRAHTGWAAAVAIALDGAVPIVVDRRRVDLHDPHMPLEMYHVARTMPRPRAEKMLEDATQATDAMAEHALSGLIDELSARGIDVKACGVVLGNGRMMLPPDATLASHAGSHAAEGELYRQSLVRAANAIGLATTGIAERELYDGGATLLKTSAAQLRATIGELGIAIGPPWTQDQKSAALIAWIGLTRAPKPPPAST